MTGRAGALEAEKGRGQGHEREKGQGHETGGQGHERGEGRGQEIGTVTEKGIEGKLFIHFFR